MPKSQRLVSLFALLILLGVAPSASDAAATATITLNKTEFKAGDTLAAGCVQLFNSSAVRVYRFSISGGCPP